MGYRSDIKAVFYTSDKEQWPALRLFVDENFPEALKGDLEMIGSSTYCGYVFSCEGVKWYDGYDDVKAYNKFVADYEELIENAEGDEELPWMYEFLRIGEDTEDIEATQAGDAQYLLRVRREIDCDF
jgi:hypothetical protein